MRLDETTYLIIFLTVVTAIIIASVMIGRERTEVEPMLNDSIVVYENGDTIHYAKPDKGIKFKGRE